MGLHCIFKVDSPTKAGYNYLLPQKILQKVRTEEKTQDNAHFLCRGHAHW